MQPTDAHTHSGALMNPVVNRLFPVHSNRRMVVRVLRQVLRAPHTVFDRFNWENWSNFVKLRSHRFVCPVCGHEVTPLYDFPDIAVRREHRVGILRETLQCRSCFTSMRQRTLALGLLDYINTRLRRNLRSVAELGTSGFDGLRVLDTDNFSAISRLLRATPGYVRCSYLPTRPFGRELEPGYFNIDLQHIDFPDESFDVVLSSDVMEHVRDCDAAHSEILRILKPGGAYLFNVPFDETLAENLQLVDTSTDQDIFLCKPHIHGDVLSTGGILAYRVFGRELITNLEQLGFTVEFHRIERRWAGVFGGDLFVALKSTHPRGRHREGR